jgi:selenocysteine-specific elongation factor
VRVLAALVENGRLAGRGGYYATLDHHPQLLPEQQALFDELIPRDSHSFVPVPFAGVVSGVKRSKVEGAPTALDTLLALGALVRVGDDCYRGSQIAAVRSRVETYLRESERMTAAQFRDLIGTSRKYALPLLEWLDAHGVTVRDGDYRTLRTRPLP